MFSVFQCEFSGFSACCCSAVSSFHSGFVGVTALGLLADAEVLEGGFPVAFEAVSEGGWAQASVRPKAATANAPAQMNAPAGSGRNGRGLFKLEEVRRRIRSMKVQSEAFSALRNWAKPGSV